MAPGGRQSLPEIWGSCGLQAEEEEEGRMDGVREKLLDDALGLGLSRCQAKRVGWGRRWWHFGI